MLEQLETYSRRLFDAVDYVGLGTCEFMVTEQGKVYFLEVNPRLQVEHTVSEEVCGLDLVREQLTIANGGELTVEGDPDHEAEDAIWVDFADLDDVLSYPNERKIAWLYARKLNRQA